MVVALAVADAAAVITMLLIVVIAREFVLFGPERVPPDAGAVCRCFVDAIHAGIVIHLLPFWCALC